jgi:hypothetical protein
VCPAKSDTRSVSRKVKIPSGSKTGSVALDLMFYAALAIVAAVGCAVLFVGGWLIRQIEEDRR